MDLLYARACMSMHNRGQNKKWESEKKKKDMIRLCARVVGWVMLDEPNRIVARLGWNKQAKRKWAKPNGSQIRQDSAMNYDSSREQKFYILRSKF